MSETSITQLPDPAGFSADPFTEVIRDGARKLIEQAIHAELATLMAAFSKEKLDHGRARLVRHRTKRSKACPSRKTGLAMAFKLMMSAQKKWRKLDGQNRLPEIIQGIEFRDGIRRLQPAA